MPLTYDASGIWTIRLRVTAGRCPRCLWALLSRSLSGLPERGDQIHFRGLGSKWSHCLSIAGPTTKKYIFCPAWKIKHSREGPRYQIKRAVEDPSLPMRSGSTRMQTKTFRPSSALSSFPRCASRASQLYHYRTKALLL